MPAIATGSYTIIDYNDAPLLNGWISVQGSKTQGFTPDTGIFVPDYTVTPLRLTASLFAAGTSTDLLDHPEGVISNIKWAVTNSAGTRNDITGATSRVYSINTNLTSDDSKTYIFMCDYQQPITRLSIPIEISVDICKVVNGTGIADAVIVAPNGNIFKNENVSQLTVECQLWSGSTIDTDVNESNYLWWKMDPNGKGGSHNIGTGWTKLISGTNGYIITYRNATSVLTIPRSDVVSSEVYMCTIYCPSPGHKQVYKETINILDVTDPILVSINSTGGSVFKNGIGSTIFTAMLFQNSEQIDSAGTKYTYNWYKYDKNGQMVNKAGEFSDGSTPYMTGKSINITSDDVFEKATFRCDIS